MAKCFSQVVRYFAERTAYDADAGCKRPRFINKKSAASSSAVIELSGKDIKDQPRILSESAQAGVSKIDLVFTTSSIKHFEIEHSTTKQYNGENGLAGWLQSK